MSLRLLKNRVEFFKIVCYNKKKSASAGKRGDSSFSLITEARYGFCAEFKTKEKTNDKV